MSSNLANFTYLPICDIVTTSLILVHNILKIGCAASKFMKILNKNKIILPVEIIKRRDRSIKISNAKDIFTSM